MIEANLIQIEKDGRESFLGAFKFVALPREGEGLVMVGPSSFLHHLKVRYVNHRPAPVSDPDDSPTATVYADLLDIEF